MEKTTEVQQVFKKYSEDAGLRSTCTYRLSYDQCGHLRCDCLALWKSALGSFPVLLQYWSTERSVILLQFGNTPSSRQSTGMWYV
jgi:hypothetical protein